jgi:hypothetical protein
MPKARFTDDVLGPVCRDEKNGWWQFDAGPVAGRPLPCVLITWQASPSAKCLRHVRQTVLWLRANEPQLRRRVAAGMLNYLNREYIAEPGKDQVDSAETIEAAIRIAEVTFVEAEPARVGYETLGLLRRCGWETGISIEIDAKGHVVEGPEPS